MNYGVIGNINTPKRYGRLISADGKFFTFLFGEYQGSNAPYPKMWQAVKFDIAQHPWEAGRQVAKNVQDVCDLPHHTARVTLLREGHGFLRLDSGDGVFFFTQMAPMLSVGDTVSCTVVPGRDKHLFALTVVELHQPGAASAKLSETHALHRPHERVTSSERVARPMSTGPTIAAATKIGTRHGKDVNDDAFLVYPMLGGEAWLLAIADGISRPENGWWASDKCMELVWRLRKDVEQRFVEEKGREQQIVSEWLDRINRDFLRERSSQPPDFQQSSSTLTLAVVRGQDVYWAHCGDTRLFVLDPKRYQLKGAFSDDLETQRSQTKYRRSGLSSHIAAKGKDWNPLSSHLRIPEGGILLLCSDGVVTRDRELKWAKSSELKKLLDAGENLQSAVAGVLARIQASGETDDLSLVAFRPTAEPHHATSIHTKSH